MGAILALAFGAGCGDSGPAEPAGPVPASISITPSTVTLAALGQTVQLTATVLDAGGQIIAGVEVIWASSDASTATVSADGLVTAVWNGSATISAASRNGVVSSATVTVAQQAADIRLSPAVDTLRALDDTLRMSTEAFDANGHPVDGVEFTWSSSYLSVARVDSTGLVTALGDGDASIIADAGPARGTATVTVAQTVIALEVSPTSDTLRALGDTVRLSADAQDANGNPIAKIVLTWSSSDEAVAAVDGSGLVTAVGVGSARVTAVSGSVNATAVVAVLQETEEVLVSPAADTLRAVGDTLRLRAEAVDHNGNPVVGTVFTWSSSDEAVAVVDESGLVTAVWHGSATVTVASGSETASVVVTVEFDLLEPREALEALYTATGGQHWRVKHNWLTDAPLGSWYGIITDGQGRVTELNLPYNGLRGPIPLELAFLPRLKRLEVQGNQLSGPIPPTLANLVGLQHFNAASNRLTGMIPPELGRLTNLSYLRVSSNNLEGPIPPELGKLANLTRLYLHNNRGLTGSIPAELGNLVNLRSLWLASNSLTGPIPPEIGNLVNLDSLYFSHNGLTGSLPPELGRLALLTYLHIEENRLTGMIPPEIGNMTNLKRIYLARNVLIGPLPSELGDLNRLVHVDLSENRISGPIPPELGNLANLEKLWLNDNELEGSIPPELGNLGHLIRLVLQGNKLSGQIPASLGDLGRLQYLFLPLNELTGPIPSELGRLGNLLTLSLSSNRLTGAIPPELGNLSRLEGLWLHENELSGELPRELVALPLSQFWWFNTGLCAPADRRFQAWLSSVDYARNGPLCFLDPRDALVALYDATAGPNWKNNTNWRTSSPVSTWYGTVVDEDGRLAELDLGGNGLAGSLPKELGDLVDLRRLDFGENDLTGSIPATLGHLANLEELHLPDNRLEGTIPPELGSVTNLRQIDVRKNRLSGRLPRELGNLGALKTLAISLNDFTGSLPPSLSELRGLEEFLWNDTGLCAPEGDLFQAWLRGIARHAGDEDCSSPLLLSVSGIHLNQAAQNLEGDVPLIAERPALLRVFVTADRGGSGYRPLARAAFFVDGRKVHNVEMGLASRFGFPDGMDPGRLDQSFSATIPAGILVPGTEIVVEIDPDSVVPRAPGSEVRVPKSGRLQLDVREVRRMELTVVPILVEASPDSSVLNWAAALGPAHPATRLTESILPVHGLDVSVRDEPYRSTVDLSLGYRAWVDLLQDFQLLRLVENGDGYYYGVVRGPPGPGVRGVAYVGRPASLGFPDPEVMAHELGHSMNLQHAPCGLLFDDDPGYPYPEGTIGTWGYDSRSGRLVSPSTRDFMSYCEPTWISDYHFRKALDFRLATETAPTPIMADVTRKRLLLWGGVSPEGELRLNPAFALEAPAKPSSGSGPYRIDGFAANGTREFSVSFAVDEIEHGGGGFLFTIPFEVEWSGSLDRILLSGPEGTATLDRESTAPMALVIDRDTGRLLSVVRDWNPVAAMGAGMPADGPTELLVSYGLPGVVPN